MGDFCMKGYSFLQFSFCFGEIRKNIETTSDIYCLPNGPVL